VPDKNTLALRTTSYFATHASVRQNTLSDEMDEFIDETQPRSRSLNVDISTWSNIQKKIKTRIFHNINWRKANNLCNLKKKIHDFYRIEKKIILFLLQFKKSFQAFVASK